MRVTVFTLGFCSLASLSFADGVPVYDVEKFGFAKTYSAVETGSNECQGVLNDAADGKKIEFGQLEFFLNCLSPGSVVNTEAKVPLNGGFGEAWGGGWSNGNSAKDPIPWAFERIPG